MLLNKAERERRKVLFAKGLKPCSKCGETLPLTAFSKATHSSTGFNSWCRLCVKAYRSGRQQAIADYNRQYQQQNLAYWRRYGRQYRKEHRDMFNRINQRRRAQKAALPATLTDNEWLVALTYFGDCCAYCGASGVLLHQEHIVPVNASGGYVADNIIPACGRCNSSKGDKPLEEWAKDGGGAFLLPTAIEMIRAYQENR